MYGLVLMNSGFTRDIDLIIPVPLHPSKERIRGFNQSYLISLGISRCAGFQVRQLKRKNQGMRGGKTLKAHLWLKIAARSRVSIFCWSMM
jgi:predicted amidophosphoribosyltransferase